MHREPPQVHTDIRVLPYLRLTLSFVHVHSSDTTLHSKYTKFPEHLTPRYKYRRRRSFQLSADRTWTVPPSSSPPPIHYLARHVPNASESTSPPMEDTSRTQLRLPNVNSVSITRRIKSRKQLQHTVLAPLEECWHLYRVYRLQRKDPFRFSFVYED